MRRLRLVPVVAFALWASTACGGSTPPKAAGPAPNSTAPVVVPPLTHGSGCGWVSAFVSDAGSTNALAIDVSPEALSQLVPGESLPMAVGDGVTVSFLTGENLAEGFCTDVANNDSSLSSATQAIGGTVLILVPDGSDLTASATFSGPRIDMTFTLEDLRFTADPAAGPSFTEQPTPLQFMASVGWLPG